MVRLAAEASADAEAIRIRKVADATAESIEKVNHAIQSGGDAYFKYRQIEMLPQLVPMIAQALADSKMVTISGGENGGGGDNKTNKNNQVIQTAPAAQTESEGTVGGAGPSAAPAKRAVAGGGAGGEE